MIIKIRQVLLVAIMVMAITTVCADDHDKTFQEIVVDYGYPLESYEVQTVDGYLLKTFRIPHGRDQNPSNDRPAVLIQHGSFDSSDFVIMNGPELSLAFYLANQGYDVWIGNGRGNKFSRKHTTLDPDTDISFWDFSFVERLEDDRANIEFITKKTGFQKIAVIAHSEATASFWAGMSQYPTWYSEKVSILIALGPVSRLDNIKTFLLRSLGANGLSIGLIKAFGIHEFFYPDFLTKLWFSTICGYVPQICRFSTSLISDGDTSVDDLEALRTYYGHYPAGISIKSLEHTLQIYMNSRFAYFDYGTSINQEKYGADQPPLINMDNIQGTPIALLVGNTDLLGDPEDNEWLKNQLRNNVVAYKTYDYGHITFFIGKDMKYLGDVKSLLQTHSSPVPTSVVVTKTELKKESN